MGEGNDPGLGRHVPDAEASDSRRAPLLAQPETTPDVAGGPAQGHDAPEIGSGGMHARQPLKRPSKRRRPRGGRRAPHLSAASSPDAPAAQDGQTQSVLPTGPRPALMTLHDAAKRLAMESELGAHAPALITLKRWSAARHLEGSKHFLPGRHHPLYNYAVIKEFCLQRLPVRAFTAVSYHSPARPLLAPEPAPSEPAPAPATPQRPVEPEPQPAALQAATPRKPHADEVRLADGAPSSTPAHANPPRDRGSGHQESSQDVARAHAFQAQVLGTLQDLSNQMEAFGTHLVKLAAAVSDLEHTRKTLMARYDGEMTSLRMRLEQLQGSARDTPGLEVAAARLGHAAHRIEAALGGFRPADPGQAPSPARAPSGGMAPAAPAAPVMRATHAAQPFLDEED